MERQSKGTPGFFFFFFFNQSKAQIRTSRRWLQMYNAGSIRLTTVGTAVQDFYRVSHPGLPGIGEGRALCPPLPPPPPPPLPPFHHIFSWKNAHAWTWDKLCQSGWDATCDKTCVRRSPEKLGSWEVNAYIVLSLCAVYSCETQYFAPLAKTAVCWRLWNTRRDCDVRCDLMCRHRVNNIW